ncbi:MAG: hypothetical protein LBE56_04620, partial [Tannerella sp.]|nr:hypothetical protein [Tannerella sp.]
GPLSISIIRNLLTDSPQVQQVPEGAQTDKGVLESVFMGLAVSPDKSIIYVAGGQANKVYLFDAATGAPAGEIDCSYKDETIDYSHGYIGDMTLSRDGKTLYAVDQINFRMVILDTGSRTLAHNVPVGRYPFGITLSRDGKKAYVANVGMYEYKPFTFTDSLREGQAMLPFPPFSYLSEDSEKGMIIDSIKVEGLGSPNTPESFSVFTIDLSDPAKPYVKARTKTGVLVGQPVDGIPAVGGSSPNSLVATDQYVFVTNATNDNISVISIEKDTVVATIPLSIDRRLKSFRGIIPFGLALSPDQKRLYVAESGINAVGIIDVATLKLTGHIPVGWFPSKLQVTPDGKKLIVANAKGWGSGPNGGSTFTRGPEGSYIGALMKGSVSVIDIPSDGELKKLSQQVVDNNFRFTKTADPGFDWRRNNPVPLYPGEKESPIKHIVFISKENRTYDEIFGQVTGGKGDASIARFGFDADITNRAGTLSLEDVTVSPNHLGLAGQFSISDNFYVDSDVSADGHRWLINSYPNEWTETTVAANYGGNRSFRQGSKAPGVYAMNSSAGAIYPEDYNEAGSIWEHFDRHNASFFNFGFSTMFEPASYKVDYLHEGIRHLVNFPLPTERLLQFTSHQYPTYNLEIPDQFRVSQFIKEFNEKWMSGQDSMPQLLTVIIPNDHGAGEHPDTGYPFNSSYMADNDLAVGRIVEFLSHTPYWQNMCIVITEDDAQGGVDHVDAHRSVLMVISPWAKKGHVSHTHASFGSIFKTFWNILGLPYINQYDAGATDLADCFSDTPDYTPYQASPVDPRLFDPVVALSPFNESFDWKSMKAAEPIDFVPTMINDSKERDEYRLEYREKKE